MPYIQLGDKLTYEESLQDLNFEINKKCTPGDLNYLLTRICLMYIQHRGKNYTHLNDVVGVLECCKQELYRRIISKYEDEKRDLNGEVYG
jgi:hypothetical protein